MSGTPAAPRTVPLKSAQGRWILLATVLGSGMIFLDSTVVNVALAHMQTDLAAPLSGLQWIVDSYALLLAAFLLLGGSLGDIYGRKLIFLVGLVVFTVASVGCGLAPNLGVLIGARALQGLGGALLVPGSLAMIKAVIAPEDSGRAIGLWAGLSGATTAIGPLVGGYLVQAISWRGIFFINIPLAAFGFWVTSRHVPPNRDPNAVRDLDVTGAFLSVVALGGVTFGLIEGPDLGWKSLPVLVSLIVGALCLLAFPFRELRTRYPMMPLNLFRSRNFTGSNLATLAVYFCFSGVLLYFTLDLQELQGYTPVEAGIAGLPLTFILLVLSPRIGGLVNRMGTRLLMTAGSAMIALGLVLLMRPGLHTTYVVDFLPGLIVLALGLSLFVTPLTTTVMGSVPPNLVGVASGVNNAMSRIASLLAIAVLGVLLLARFDATLTARLEASHIPTPARQALLSHDQNLLKDPIPASLPAEQKQAARLAVDNAFLDGFRWILGTCALLCLLSAAICWTLIRYKPGSG